MDILEQIKARIFELESNRAQFIAEAQKQIFGFDAAIGELKALLDTPDQSEKQPTTLPENE